MKLTRVTITGADDAAQLTELEALTWEFPFVEWGILLSKSRLGDPRYPGVGTFAAFAQSGISGHMAVHLCGEEARRCFAGEGPPRAVWISRRQVNGFTKFVDEHGLLTPFGQWIHSQHRASHQTGVRQVGR